MDLPGALGLWREAVLDVEDDDVALMGDSGDDRGIEFRGHHIATTPMEVHQPSLPASTRPGTRGGVAAAVCTALWLGLLDENLQPWGASLCVFGAIDRDS